MDYFSFDGTLSDEIILNILLQIPGAGSFLSFGATCQRLRDICRFEEDRYHVWRHFYAWRWKLNPEELLLAKPSPYVDHPEARGHQIRVIPSL
jgi:hypothetical protein